MLILIRGLPGSGKSTLAKQFLSMWAATDCHYETDMYWLRPDGRYDFNSSLLKEAHAWCQQQTLLALKEGRNVIVSNTFVKHWEMQPYIDMTHNLKIPYEIRTALGTYKNVHNVPEEVIERMRANWEE